MLIDKYFQKQASQVEAPPLPASASFAVSLKKRQASEATERPLAYRHKEWDEKRCSEKEVSPVPARRVSMMLDEYFDNFLEKDAGFIPKRVRLNKWNWKLTRSIA